MAVFDKVKEVVMDELSVAEDQVTPGAQFTEDLGADSLAVIEIMMRIEEEFNIEIPDADAESIRTVAEAVAYVEGKAKQS